ncbi:MAG: hypothetical protein CM1200mP30_29070 [Pseudomonadota bacterium]|nr:MAG: hypothetical protein CM1200mP30_29070 [Pseudomonadota bacterium]
MVKGTEKIQKPAVNAQEAHEAIRPVDFLKSLMVQAHLSTISFDFTA